MDFPRTAIRFGPAPRKRGRAGPPSSPGGSVPPGTPRTTLARIPLGRGQHKTRRNASPDSQLPSFSAGSQWRGATTSVPTPVPSPLDPGDEEWETVFGPAESDAVPMPRTRATRYHLARQATYNEWSDLVPRLVAALRAHHGSGDDGRSMSEGQMDCCSDRCGARRSYQVVCIGFTGYAIRTAVGCPDHPVALALVRFGFWPSSPRSAPRAFALDLLDHYLHLYDACATPNDAFCEALVRSQAEQGIYYLTADQTRPLQDPWRRGFSSASLWYDRCRWQWESDLRRQIEERLPPSMETGPPGEGDLRPARASARMQLRCPACFGLIQWGRSPSSGADVLVALDGNRQLKRLRTGGISPLLFEPDLYLPRAAVATARARMEAAKAAAAGRPDRRTSTKLDQEALDRCRKAFKVADEEAQLVSEQVFDVTGVVILVCRHDVPLFVCDITTPGERQEYAFALIWALLEELPAQASVGVLYDIGCQVDHSCDLYGYLGSDRDRVTFACSVLHAYGHEWACQVVYNPRRRTGFGLTDGEGSERVWSRTRRLIPILRRANDARRVFILERKFQRCGQTMTSTLGAWMARKLKLIRRRRADAQEVVEASGLSLLELRRELEKQRADPYSFKRHTVGELQRKIEIFKRLQQELQRLGVTIQETARSMSEEFGLSPSSHTLQILRQQHEDLMRHGERLLADLRVDRTLPELAGVTSECLQYLLLAREEKINIRTRVVDHLWELSRLHRARGGRHDPVGTKVRDAILKGWGPRWRATKTAVERYNGYVDRLTTIIDPIWNVPVPPRLDLNALRNPSEDDSLWQDVWWPTLERPPIWAISEKVRSGITSMLIMDRCREEEDRLVMEAGNMERWWAEEMWRLVQAREQASGAQITQSRWRRASYKIADRGDQVVLDRLIREQGWLRYRWTSRCIPAERWARVMARLRASLAGPADEPAAAQDTAWASGLHWREPQTPADWDRRSQASTDAESNQSDAYDRVMADMDAMVEELGAVVIDSRDLDDTSEGEEVAGDQTEEVNRSAELNSVSGDQGNRNRSLTPTATDDPGRIRTIVAEWSSDQSWAIDSWSVEEADRLTDQLCELGGSGVGNQIVRLNALDQKRLVSRSEWLSDAHINDFGSLFECLSRSSEWARPVQVFSTFAWPALERISSKREGLDAWYQKYVARRRRGEHSVTEPLHPCWIRPHWLIPVHKNGNHWILAHVDVENRRITVHDSLSDGAWSEDVEIIQQMVWAIVQASAAPFPGGSWSSWRARRGPTRNQVGSSECGLWVLAHMLAIVRGYDGTGQSSMADFRGWLSDLVQRLPGQGQEQEPEETTPGSSSDVIWA